MHLHNLSKNWEWRWPSNANTSGTTPSESVSRVRDGEVSSQTTTERQEIVERDNWRRQMMQEKDTHDQRRYQTKITQKRLDKLTRGFPYDNGRKTSVSLGENQITIADVRRLNNQKKTGRNTWEVHFGNGNKDTQGNSTKEPIYGGNGSRSDDLLGMNERRSRSEMAEDELKYDEPNYSGERKNHVPRSPIRQIQRVLVQDEKRNFGDYDPVRSQYIPRSAEIRTSLPTKLDKRRILFKGIPSEEDIKSRRKQEEKTQQESDWRAELNKSYDRNIGNYRSSENDYEYQGASTYNEFRRSDFRSALNSRQEVVSYTEEEVDDHSEDGYDQRYQDPEVNFTSEKIIEEETRYKRKYTMSANEDTYRGSYPGWKLPSQAQDLQRAQGNTSATYDRRSPLASSSAQNQKQASSSWMDFTQGTGFFQSSAETKSGEKKSGTSPVNEGYVTKGGNVDVRSYDSRFELGRNESQFADEIYKLEYFYRLQRRQTEEKHGIEYFGFLLEFWPKDAPDLSEVVFGYQMTDEAQAQDSVFAAGLMRLKNTYHKNEEAIRLRKIEKAKARGNLYRQNPIFSALGPGSAFGLTSVKPNRQVADEIEEEDDYGRTGTNLGTDRYSLDAEAEHKGYSTAPPKETRSNITERKGYLPAHEEIRPQLTERIGYATPTPLVERSNLTERRGYLPAHEEPLPRLPERTRYFTAPEEVRSHQSERKSSKYPEEEETDSHYESYGPKKTEAIVKDKDDSFRIAIPRGPSIIWDTRRGGKPLERNRSGLGYQGRKSK